MCGSELPTTELAPPPSDRRTLRTRDLVGHISAVLAALGIMAGIILFRDQIRDFPNYGYPAVFVISLIGNATIILPTPTAAVVFGVAGSLNPVAVGILAGLGSAVGEMTGYLAGVGGRIVVEDRALYNRIENWMRKRGIIVIFVLALIPNPVFDVGGMIAGALKMPAWQFLLAAWAGKGLRLVLFALSGRFVISEFLTIF